MPSNEDKERIEHKRQVAIDRIAEIAPFADTALSFLDETKLDMLLLALGKGSVQVNDGDTE